MDQDNLREICLIVNKRNELQKVRNSARHKVVRLERILQSKRREVVKCKLERTADPKRNRSVKFFNKLVKDEFSKCFPDHDVAHAYRQMLYNMKMANSNAIEHAKDELSNNWKHTINHPTKYNNISRHKIKTMMQKHIAEREMAMYEIMQHTEETTKRLRKLLTKNNMHMRSDSNGGVDYILYANAQNTIDHMGKAEIRKIAFDAIAERELLDV